MAVRTRAIVGDEARRGVLAGAALTARVVGTTLGPRGRTVLIQQGDGQPISTKDGVTCARALSFKDPIMRLGSELIKEASSRTNELAGDGTTTTAVIAHALMEEGVRFLPSYPCVEIVEGINLAVENIERFLKESAVRITDRDVLRQVATVSANNDASIGELIASAFDRVGRSGIVTVEDARGTATTLELVEGFRFERGYISPYFVTHADKMVSQHLDALVLITDKRISLAKDIVPALELAAGKGRALLVIADDIVDEALQTLVLNRTKGNCRVCAVRAPGHGDSKVEMLRDVACLANGEVISAASGRSLDRIEASSFGSLKSFVVDRSWTTLIGSAVESERVAGRVDEILGQLEDVTLSDAAREVLRVRSARLSSGIAVIKVGGATELEMVERKYRVEDALNAARAAIDEGILPGGGAALARASQALPSSSVRGIQAGIDTVARACSAPLRTIVSNAAGMPDVVLSSLLALPGSSHGYDARRGEFIEMLEAGVIDPARVTRLALLHASSVACTFLSTDSIVVEENDA